MCISKSKSIPLLEEGSERELMTRILFRVKRVKGLTTALVQCRLSGRQAKTATPLY